MAAFGYNIFLTGDCSNTCSGAVRLTASGGTPPYYFDWGNCIYESRFISSKYELISKLRDDKLKELGI